MNKFIKFVAKETIGSLLFTAGTMVIIGMFSNKDDIFDITDEL